MNIFVSGASGYIGGSIAARLLHAGHRVRGLTREAATAERLRERGIEAVVATLDDAAVLEAEARRADAVVNAASSDHRGAVEALVRGLEGSGKPLLHTSGSSIVADYANGEPSERVFDEEGPFEPVPEKAARVALDRSVLEAAARGVRSVVLCNTLIYGRGSGLHRTSVQLPSLVAQARASGIPRHMGRGLNIWSTVHIEDVADLYLLALEQAPAGTFMFVENGEASFEAMVTAIGEKLGLGPAQSWPAEEAIREWGFEKAVLALGSNSRVRAKAARDLLGWAPKHASVLDAIRHDLAGADG